jgi:hypothetical protein
MEGSQGCTWPVKIYRQALVVSRVSRVQDMFHKYSFSLKLIPPKEAFFFTERQYRCRTGRQALLTPDTIQRRTNKIPSMPLPQASMNTKISLPVTAIDAAFFYGVARLHGSFKNISNTHRISAPKRKK